MIGKIEGFILTLLSGLAGFAVACAAAGLYELLLRST